MNQTINAASTVRPGRPGYPLTRPTSQNNMMAITEQPSCSTAPSQSAEDMVANAVSSVRVKCPGCRQDVDTVISYEIGCCTLCVCTLLFFCGMVAGCCVMPFFFNSNKDCVHYCPKCDYQIGVNRRIC
ncbi:LITAF domain-containing protein-like [Glandiceps talaboti]